MLFSIDPFRRHGSHGAAAILAAIALAVSLFGAGGTLAADSANAAVSPAILLLETGPPEAPAARLASFRQDTAVSRTCCKICRKGKPCGNSCISRDKSCHKAPGCACAAR